MNYELSSRSLPSKLVLRVRELLVIMAGGSEQL